MSKSALKALANADTMIKAAGVHNAAPLVEYLNDGKNRHDQHGRKLWRNADALASLLISAAGSCFQCETPDTLKDHGFTDMAEAVDRYVASALDSWSQVEWMACGKDSRSERDRLLDMVNAHIEYVRRRELVQSLEKQIGANNRELVSLDIGSTKSKELAVINIALREMVRRINGESPDFRIMPSADVKQADEATAKICTSCADYLDNDNLDAFCDGHDDLLQTAAASLRAWSYGWKIIGTDKDKVDQDVGFKCECCKQRIHGQRFTLRMSEAN